MNDNKTKIAEELKTLKESLTFGLGARFINASNVFQDILRETKTLNDHLKMVQLDNPNFEMFEFQKAAIARINTEQYKLRRMYADLNSSAGKCVFQYCNALNYCNTLSSFACRHIDMLTTAWESPTNKPISFKKTRLAEFTEAYFRNPFKPQKSENLELLNFRSYDRLPYQVRIRESGLPRTKRGKPISFKMPEQNLYEQTTVFSTSSFYASEIYPIKTDKLPLIIGFNNIKT